MVNRRGFIKKAAPARTAIAMAPIAKGVDRLAKAENLLDTQEEGVSDSLIVPKNNRPEITGTLSDEISHDIPHQNWGEKGWNQDFKYVKTIGIDTAVVVRYGYREFMTYLSEYLVKRHGCYMPSVDLIGMYLRLVDRYSMRSYFSLYDSGRYWNTGDISWGIEDNKYVIDEVWKRCGHRKSFKGWYISTEISRQTKDAIPTFHALDKQCKDVSDGLPVFISPWIDGKEAVMGTQQLSEAQAVPVEEHEREWNEILGDIHDVVDAHAFQDGHIDYDELDVFSSVSKKLADRYGMQCWANARSSDRDMPIKFLPIKFDKLRMKLEATKRCHYDKTITFELSYFMSPQSVYVQAHHLYDRYKGYSNIR